MAAIRLANVSDAGDIYKVHTSSIREICSNDYTDEEIKSWISRQNVERYKEFIERGEMVVLDDGGEIKGFGHLSQQIDDKNRASCDSQEDKDNPCDVAFVRALYVHPDHVGRGIGHQLLSRMQRQAQQSLAKTLVVFSTLNAISFYEKHGFKVIGLTKQCRGCVDLNCTKMEKQL